MFKLSFLSLLLVSSFASAEEARRADAHVHGLNNLSMESVKIKLLFLMKCL